MGKSTLKYILSIMIIVFLGVNGYAQLSGTYTTNEYFYLPGYGSFGLDELAEYNLYMEKADNQIQANKEAIVDWTADQDPLKIHANNYVDTNTTYSAGTGMQLNGTTFNCTVTDTDTTYSAGTGLNLTGTTFSSTITQYTDALAKSAVATEGYLRNITSEKFADLSDIPVHPGAGKMLETTALGYKYIDTPSGGGGGEDKTKWIYPQDYATGSGTAVSPWANDCIDTAISNASAGDTVYLRAGYYKLTGWCKITKAINLIGEGIGRTIILTDDNHGIHWDAVDGMRVEGMTIDGTSQSSDYYYGLYPTNSSKGIVRDVEVKNCSETGINPYQVNWFIFENVYTHDNLGHGIHPGTNSNQWNNHNYYRNIYCYNNGVAGFDDRGLGQGIGNNHTYNTFTNIYGWDNAHHGINICYQDGIIIDNCMAWDNDRCGFYLQAMSDVTVSNCYSEGNNIDGGYFGLILTSAEGHASYTCKNVTFNNLIIKNTQSNGEGIKQGGTDNVFYNNCRIYDDQVTKTQTYGLWVVSGNSKTIISNSDFSGNKTANLRNDNNNLVIWDGVKMGYNAQAGDILYHDGTDWVRLAKDVGKYLKSGNSSVSWDTPDAGGASFEYEIPASNQTYSAISDVGTVGENVVFGDLLYFKWSDKKYYKARANDSTTADVVAMAVETKSINQSCTIIRQGYVRNDSWSNFADSKIYLSTGTAGAMQSTIPNTSGQQIKRVGDAVANKIIYFNPSADIGEVK